MRNVVDLNRLRTEGHGDGPTEVDYTTDFLIGHTPEGLILLSFRSGLVTTSVTLAPEGAYTLGLNLCSASTKVMPDPETFMDQEHEKSLERREQ